MLNVHHRSPQADPTNLEGNIPKPLQREALPPGKRAFDPRRFEVDEGHAPCCSLHPLPFPRDPFLSIN